MTRREALFKMRFLAIITLVFIFLCQGGLIVRCEGGEVKVRKSMYAGSFYPGDKRELKEMVDNFLKEANPLHIKERVIVMIVPHAGYIYSGPVAGYAYKLIKELSPERIILMGPSHQYPLDGPLLYGEGIFSTPLGDVRINSELTDKIKKSCPSIRISQEAHKIEHSLEVQLPFLQVALSTFEIVPILVPPHSDSWDEEKLAKALAELLKEDKGLIVLASSDMSHYHPYKEARRMDEGTVKLIKGMSIKELGEGILSGRNELCGDGAVLAGLLAARDFGGVGVEVLSFANSGDTQGDKTKVVGYTAIAVYKKENKNGNKDAISKETEEEILNIARATIEKYVNERNVPQVNAKSAIFKEKRGVFVTLTKHGELRGCIGRFEPDEEFLRVLQKMAVASATQDYRFPPVTAGELKDIDIEVSILSPLKKISSLDEFIVGEHGIYMKKGLRTATFLPQVATEQGWNKEETLSHLSLKAGLGPEEWRGAEFYIYTTTIIK